MADVVDVGGPVPAPTSPTLPGGRRRRSSGSTRRSGAWPIPVGELGKLLGHHPPARRSRPRRAEREAARRPCARCRRLRPDRLEDGRRGPSCHRSWSVPPGSMGVSLHVMLDRRVRRSRVAIDVLAKRKPDQDTGEHDSRTRRHDEPRPARRLGHKLVGAPEGVPRQAKTSLVVTIGLDVLQGRCRGGGHRSGCKVILVGDGAPVGVRRPGHPGAGTEGRGARPGQGRAALQPCQIRHLWMRDQHCTFPGRFETGRVDGRTPPHTLARRRADGHLERRSCWRTTPQAHQPACRAGRRRTPRAVRAVGPRQGSYATRLAAWRAERESFSSTVLLDHEPAPHPARRRRGICPARSSARARRRGRPGAPVEGPWTVRGTAALHAATYAAWSPRGIPHLTSPHPTPLHHLTVANVAPARRGGGVTVTSQSGGGRWHRPPGRGGRACRG